MLVFFSLHFQITMKLAKSIVNQIKLYKFLNKLKFQYYRAKLYRCEYVKQLSKIIFMTINEEIWEKIVNPADSKELKEVNKVFLSIEISSFVYNFKSIFYNLLFLLDSL